MIVALPTHAGDIEAARELLRWIGKLDPKLNHDLLIVADAGTPFDKVIGLKEIGSQIFKATKIVTNPAPVSGWPAGCYSLFCTAIRNVTDSFLILEPDAVPTHSGWLDQIAEDYAVKGQPFLGHIYSGEGEFAGRRFMSGIAVYPADMKNRITIKETPVHWDVEYADVMVRDGAHTPLIKNLFGQMDLPPVFVEAKNEHSPINSFTLDYLNGAAIFHRDKTHSLIPLLAKKLGIAWKVIPTPVVGADVVSLRRAGDIINLLPALRRESLKRGRKMRLVVHRDFAPVLDGVSYVEPVIWDGSWEDPITAARKHNAVNAQVFGQGLRPNMQAENFAKLAWKQIGLQFNRYSPLVFDQRSAAREEELAKSVFQTDKPKILIKLHGYSSPFGESSWMKTVLTQEFQNSAEIVYLDQVKAGRLYDLLGLMDRAHCIVTVDTSTLWLCQATRTPSIQFVNGLGFSASPPRGNVILRMPYHDVTQKWGDIVRAVRKAITVSSHGNSKVLVFSDFKPQDYETQKRQDEAYVTWGSLGARLHAFHGTRTSTMLGDYRAMPFVRDMIDSAFRTGNEDIVVITNNDIRFDPKLGESIDRACREFGCWWTYRLTDPGGRTDQGADTFAFTRSWWHLHEHLFPDYLLGYYNWDDVFVRLMQWSGCTERERLIYHRPHPLTQSPMRLHTQGANYNQNLMAAWIRKHDEGWGKPNP